jgi:hypothetical protein
MTSPEVSLDDVVAKLEAHPSVLLSTKRCSQGWVRNPDDYWVCEKLKISQEDWTKHGARALK